MITSGWFMSVAAMIWLLGCSSSDNPTAPPPTMGPGTSPVMAFVQGSGFDGRVVGSIVLANDGTGDFYVGGDFTTYNGTASKGLIRLHPDGTVASTFGFDGSVAGLALARTGGSELYVLGPFTQFNGQPVPHLVRLTRTGSLDMAFRIPADLAPMSVIAPAADGSGDLYTVYKISFLNPADPIKGIALQIARLNPDGSRDPAFSTGIGFPGGGGLDNPVSITTLVSTINGRLYVGGGLMTYNGVNVESLLRLSPDGGLDSTFVANVGYGFTATVVETMALAGDGTSDLYAGGRIFEVNHVPTNGQIRVNDTGALDTIYAPAVGMVTLALAPVGDGTGDVLVFGFGEGGARLCRLNRHAAMVPTFHEPIIDREVFAIVPALDGTGDIYLGGEFTTYNGQVVNRIARIHADGTLASAGSFTP